MSPLNTQPITTKTPPIPPPIPPQRLTCGVLVIEGPGLVSVKVCVAPHPRAGVVGVGQRAPLPVKQGHVAVETGGEEQQDVGQRHRAAAVAADDAIVVVVVVVVCGYFLEGEGRFPAPHVKGLAEGGRRMLLPQGGWDLLLQQAEGFRGQEGFRDVNRGQVKGQVRVRSLGG